MKLLISDANVIIDFEDGGLVQQLFSLNETIAVPDILFEDELKAGSPGLPGLGLQTLKLQPDAVQRTVELGRLYRKPTRYDLAALALAEQEGCPLITGDGDLRTAAEDEGVEVHGSLWIAELLVVQHLISADQLGAAYKSMRSAGSRLPWRQVHAQLRRLGCRPSNYP